MLLRRSDPKLTESLARIAKSKEGELLLAWIEDSRDAMRAHFESCADEQPHERGQSAMLTALVEEFHAATKDYNKRL